MSAREAEIDEFADHVRGREITNDGTLSDYVRWVGRFELWRPGGEADEEMLRDFDSYLADEEVADYPWSNDRGGPPPAEYAYQTRVKALSALKYWLGYQYDADVPTKINDLALGEPEPFDPTVLPEREIRRIVNTASDCGNEDCRMAIKLGYDCILRGAELSNVRREDVDRDTKSLFVRSVKGSNRVTVGLSRETWTMLRRFLDRHPDRDRLFQNAYERAWKPDAWSQHFRRKHHEAGWHAVGRHSAITNRLRKGEDFGKVFQRARHQNPTMTLRYASIVDADVPEWVSDAGQS